MRKSCIAYPVFLTRATWRLDWAVEILPQSLLLLRDQKEKILYRLAGVPYSACRRLDWALEILPQTLLLLRDRKEKVLYSLTGEHTDHNKFKNSIFQYLVNINLSTDICEICYLLL